MEEEGGDEEGTWLHPKMSFSGMTFQEVFLHAKTFPHPNSIRNTLSVLNPKHVDGVSARFSMQKTQSNISDILTHPSNYLLCAIFFTVRRKRTKLTV